MLKVENREARESLRYLAALLGGWVALKILFAFLTLPQTREGGASAIGTLLGGFFLAGLLAIGYDAIRRGSKSARIVLTIYACIEIIALFLQLVLAIHYPLFTVITLGQIAVRTGVVVFINCAPIATLRPPPLVLKPRPVSATHEHNWQPDELLNDWVRCQTCRELHIEPGSIALVNSR